MAKNWTISISPTPHKLSRCFTNIQHISMFSAGIVYKVMFLSLEISAHGHRKLLRYLKPLKMTKYRISCGHGKVAAQHLQGWHFGVKVSQFCRNPVGTA